MKDMNDKKEHWNLIYKKTADEEVSWYQPHLQKSLQLILSSGVPTTGSIIDVGGGTSTLVDDLIEHGYRDITVLDISAEAIYKLKERLGERCYSVHWVEADITNIDLPANHYDLWHDRAVFHFLTDPEDRSSYIATLRRSLRPKGVLVISTFAPNGPNQCSGLDVARFSANTLQSVFGGDFQLKESIIENHKTPVGALQEFQYSIFQYAPKVQDID